MANSVDPDQTAPSGAVWSGSTLFAYVILSDALVFEFLGHLPYPVYVCSLANYSVAYEETQSNRVSNFHDFVCSLFPKANHFDF